MVVTLRVSCVVAALVIAVGACADGPEAPTSPGAADVVSAASVDRKAMLASSSAIGDESFRLITTIQNDEHRARLNTSLERLSHAMEAGDVVNARRALSAARDGLRYIDSEADRDALRLALDAAHESLSLTITHGAN